MHVSINGILKRWLYSWARWKQKINITSNKNMNYKMRNIDILKEANFQGEQRLIWIKRLGKSSQTFQEKMHQWLIFGNCFKYYIMTNMWQGSHETLEQREQIHLVTCDNLELCPKEPVTLIILFVSLFKRQVFSVLIFCLTSDKAN